VYRESEWGENNEMKIESAVINPPYGVDDVTGPPEIVNRIRKIIENAIENERSKQEPTMKIYF